MQQLCLAGLNGGLLPALPGCIVCGMVQPLQHIGKGLKCMPNIKPVSDLRNYNEVLRDIAVGEPVFLTKNGRGRYAIVDMEEYEKTRAVIKLMGELAKGEQSAKEKGWTDIAEVEKMLGVANG